MAAERKIGGRRPSCWKENQEKRRNKLSDDHYSDLPKFPGVFYLEEARISRMIRSGLMFEKVGDGEKIGEWSS